MVKGYELFGQAVAAEGSDVGFFLMGGPSNDAIKACTAQGVRMIDVRHEQAAAMMAQAYARIRAKPGFCVAASGPGTINLSTGLANALIDCAPVVAFGGSSPIGQYARGAFQEIDQLAIMKPVTKFAERVHDAARIPEYVARAFRIAASGKPGPVYLDLPGDVLYADVDEASVRWPRKQPQAKPAADPAEIARVVELLGKAERPLLLTGSGIIWSQASEVLQAFVEATGIPFYTTPQGRGVIPEDHDFFFPLARSAAFREADLVIVAGTRLNYVFSYGEPPRFSENARLVRIDIDPAEIDSSLRLEAGLVGDAGQVLNQLRSAAEGKLDPERYAPWRERLAAENRRKEEKHEASLSSDQTPIHPLRLCKEIRDFISRDAILCVDGQEILNYGRQTIPSYRPGHRLNSGPFGTMGVGLPFGLGAKAAAPERDVVVLHGDGSFGLNGLEIDTAVRHKLPVLIVISLNGGWTADPERKKPGRDLGYTRFDQMAEAFGCYGEYVERPEGIRPALERAAAEVAKGRVALVNVVTDWRARAGTANFTNYST
ncbi:thiamine pyrophosphate-binding protein [Chelativorans sp. Marseille-P2723]|uniref:thiamine pyrophosphate-binding protein n=1 Tax=Chelativorans sp. Marseille-P2723 TaxID=2709133 RepID=UPI00156F8E2A|nr:thiamine pyrophosphate-binding protein [Chelativorans sp. Marseille-P2723]